MTRSNVPDLKSVEFDLPGLRQAGFETAGGEGKPLALFYHGITANGQVFAPMMERMAAAFRCISLDQRGHGRSGKPASGYGGTDFAGDIAALVRHLNAGPALVIGHSLGARNGLVAARLHPDRVSAVVAIDFTPYIEPDVFDALESRVNGGDRLFADEASIRAYLSDRYMLMPPDAVERRTRWGYHRVEGGWRPLADPRAMSQTAAGLREDLEATLRAVKLPVLMVRGRESKLVSPAAWARTRALRPDLPAVEIDGADHYVPEERPAELVRKIEQFWRLAAMPAAVKH